MEKAGIFPSLLVPESKQDIRRYLLKINQITMVKSYHRDYPVGFSFTSRPGDYSKISINHHFPSLWQQSLGQKQSSVLPIFRKSNKNLIPPPILSIILHIFALRSLAYGQQKRMCLLLLFSSALFSGSELSYCSPMCSCTWER